MPNLLAGERSAYLRSAAHQPVDWHPWGAAAFQRARDEDKPVLLDIGAVWCHWCHVIDRESYDDPELARLINAQFVAVKVDRDVRPDVDARYQQAVQALKGQGGWPLTAFLTPEGKVFFAGTYFPPEDKYGRPGFRTVLLKVAEHYAKQKEDLLAHSEHLHQELARHAARRQAGDLDPAMVEQAFRAFQAQFDGVNGGFGTAPKFPHPAAIELCLARHARTRDPALGLVAQGTLDGMARGGVMDQLGGGFHRYSVDAEWIVPHFEKMLYDNAGLLRNYAQGWTVFGSPLHKAAAEGIVRWLREVMALPGGGFAGSQDADVGLEDDGDYWTWTVDELRAAVPDADLQRLLAAHFDIGPRGEMHHDPRKNVLFVARPVPVLARELGLPEAMVEERLAEGRARMLAARAGREAPYVDPSVFVSWNAMVASALLEAWKALGDDWCRDAAFRTLERLLGAAHREGEGMAHVLHEDGTAAVRGLLEDQVWTAHALLDAFECGGPPAWLGIAEDLLRFTVERFQDPSDGALQDTARGVHDTDGVPVLALPRKPIEDAPVASANAVAVLALDKLAALTGQEEHHEAAARVLQAFAGAAPRMGLFAGAYFLALERHLQPHLQVVVVGDPGDPRARALHGAALRHVGSAVAVFPPGLAGPVPEPARAAVESGVGRDAPAAMVCQGAQCSAPLRDSAGLARALALTKG